MITAKNDYTLLFWRDSLANLEFTMKQSQAKDQILRRETNLRLLQRTQRSDSLPVMLKL